MGHIVVAMNKLPSAKRVQILGMMVEGMSIRAITRLTGVSKNTVIKLLEDAGTAFAEYQDRELRDLPCKRVQVDEIWAFCYAKQKNVKAAKAAPAEAGDLWTWTAICADTKLVASWTVGNRDTETATYFMNDLASRLSNRIQLTSDGHRPYLEAVEDAFGAGIDYAQLIKLYDAAPEGQRRYSPATCTGIKIERITGAPVGKDISTSYVERSNLTMRMHMRRFTRLTNVFSKKAENHAHSVAINFMYYNFVRIHSTIRMTPAMAAGVTTKLWEIADMVAVLEAWEAEQEAARKPIDMGNALVG
jgi:IS1 family transposase